MKILLLQESDWVLKGPHQQHHLMERLSLQGHDVRVIDFEVGWRNMQRSAILSPRKVFREFSKTPARGSVTVVRPGYLRLPLLDMVSMGFTHLREIERQMIEFSPDVVIGMGLLNGVLGLLAVRRKRVSFVHYLLDELHRLVPYPRLGALAKAMESWVIRHSDFVYVINDQLGHYARGLGAERDRIRTIRPGVDLPTVDAQAERGAIRNLYGVGADEVLLLYLGGVFEFSGVKEVILDLATYGADHPTLKFMIVGWGRTPAIQKELEELVSRLGLDGRVIVTGRKPFERVQAYVAASDICLLPARSDETMRNIVPIKVYDYLAGARPVISTRLPGMVAEFGQDRGIFYVDGPEHVIPEVLNLLTHGVDLRKEGEKARGLVEHLTWSRIVLELADYLEGQVRESKAPPEA